MKKGTLVATGLLTGVSGASSTAVAEPSEVDACTTIEESGEYVLTEDLDADGDCLVFRDDNESCCVTGYGDVILDGNGHTISGNGTGTGIKLGRGMRIRNLHISGFGTGISDLETDGGVGGEGLGIALENTIVSDNDGGGIVSDAHLDLAMKDSVIQNNGGYGIYSGLTSEMVDVEITRSTVSGNDGPAIGDAFGIYPTVTNSAVTGNGAGIEALGGKFVDNTIRNNDGDGMRLTSTTLSHLDNSTSIVGNDVRGNSGAGIHLKDLECTIRESTIANNQNGVVISEYPDVPFSREYHFEKNNIEDNAAFGVRNAASVTAFATCNYWGDESGPIHEENPRSDPEGDRVTDGVEFVPWSTVPIENGEGNCVGGTTPPPVDDFENPPSDPDGDGEFEDVNGDGEFDTVDVQALFANRDDATVRDNPEKFDFNDDGEMNVVDVQALFRDLT